MKYVKITQLQKLLFNCGRFLFIILYNSKNVQYISIF